MLLIYFKKVYYLLVLIVFTALTPACEAPTPSATKEPKILPGGSRLSDLLSDGGELGFRQAIEPRPFLFPEDHGPHTGYRNEWWYVTGNLDGPDRERFGFELTFFRFSLTPRNDSNIRSAWQTNQVYVAHFALTDVADLKFHVAQRYARGSTGLAGSQADPFKVWLDDWSIAAIDAESEELHWALRARDTNFSLDLDLVAMKPPVLNGRNGLSQKSADNGNATYYYSQTRLKSSGVLRIGDREYAVSGLSWLDREWGSSALSPEQSGWDWFALQLSNGSDLMFYSIRRNDGAADEHSAGTWVDANGVATELAFRDVSITVRQFWYSESGARYPAAWTIDVPRLRLSLDINPVLGDQELVTNVRYWEGAVDVSGTSNGQAIAGRGYVELTGYAE